MREFLNFDVLIKNPSPYNNYRFRSFLPEGDSIQPCGFHIDYEPFQFLQHVTDLHAARSILRTGLGKNKITDNGIASSCAMKEGAVRDRESQSTVQNVVHPARALEVVWFGPRLNNGNPPEGNGPALGNIAFNLPAGFLMHLLTNAGYNCYWIENFEFGTILAARFIITREHLPGLRRYNPNMAVSGPWRVMDGHHQVQTTYLSEDRQKRVDLEFMLDLSQSDLESLHDLWTVTVRWPHPMNKAKQANKLFYDRDALVIFGLINALVASEREHRVAINIEEADDCLRNSDVGGDLLYLFEEGQENNSEERDFKLKETFLTNSGIEANLGWVIFQHDVKEYFQQMQQEADKHGDSNGKRTMFLMIREHFHVCLRQDILFCPSIVEKSFCAAI